MSVKQLFALQRLEQDIAEAEAALARAQAAVGESPALKKAKARLADAQAELAVIRAEQKSLEYAVADISAKMAVANDSLYSGRVKNPKELQDLQREIASLQARRNPLEDKDLALMESGEAAETKVKEMGAELARAEEIWRGEQRDLLVEVEKVKDKLEDLRRQRQAALPGIPAPEAALYQQIKKTRGWAVARVEQGTCGKCRLSLSTAELQRARSGQTASCSSCGRLLYFE